MIGRALLVVLALVLAALVLDAVWHPTRRRLALRNIGRRRGEAVLVVVGAMLGTAIITASLVVGDSVSASIVDSARTSLGPVDETVRVVDASQLDDVARRLEEPPLPGTDGTMTGLAANAAVATVGPDRRAVDTATVLEVDFDRARALGSDPALTGMAGAGATPRGDEAVVNERLARKLGASRGDAIDLFAYGGSIRLIVRDIIPELGLAGFGVGSSAGEVVTPIFVPAGIVDRLASSAAAGSAPPGVSAFSQPPSGVVFISNTGGVFEGGDGSNAVEARIRERLGNPQGVEIVKAKQGLVDAAQRQGDSLTQLFGSIGYFSVAAGLLLLVNLFVMLSEERKTELGMLRALGFRRNHIMRTFSLEGSVYSLIAALLGGGVGIAVGAAITRIATAIFSRGAVDPLEYQLSVKPESVVLGVGAGFAISMVTVVVTSLLISRFNIILAIRDLPRARTARRTGSLVVGGAAALFGALLLAQGIFGKNAVATIAGPSLIALAVALLVDRKATTVAASAFVVAWSALVYNLLPGIVGRPTINTFVVEGLILVAAAVTLVMQLDRVWRSLADGLGARGTGLSVRLSLAYPLARRFRTGLVLAMFTLVVLTMVFLSAFAEIFAAQAPAFTREISAGYDIMMDANPTNPVPIDAIRATPGVAEAAPLTRAFSGRYTTKFRSDRPNVTTGLTDDFVRFGAPLLSRRLPEYADDRAAFEAVIHDPTLTIVPATFLQGGGAPPSNALVPGDVVSVVNGTNGDKRDLKVAAVFDREFLQNGAFVGADFASNFLAPLAVQSRYYIKVAPGADADRVAATLQGAFVPNGADADTFVHRVDVALAQSHAFITLLRSYLGLGLLVGVAGLGVVMVRAVRERRRQIGMLRAMGFPARVVRRAFLLESSFLALQGITLGVLLGLFTSYQLLAQSDAFGDSRLPYQVPGLALVVIFTVPFLASLLAAAAPAARAARIKPAVALRIAD